MYHDCMDTATLLWGTLFGSIGLGYFIYGKKQKKPIAMACGVGLIGYTYAVTSPVLIVVVGLALMATPVIMRHR